MLSEFNVLCCCEIHSSSIVLIIVYLLIVSYVFINCFVGNMIRDLWLEYEEGETVHAKLAHQLDKFEMIVQADEYERAHPEKKILQSFFTSCEGYFVHPEVSR